MRAALILAIVVVAIAQEKINYVSTPDPSLPIELIVQRFAAQQPEVYQKVFLNFINERISFWKAEMTTDQKIREQIIFLITEPSSPLEVNLREYMQTKLFDKLEMGKLTQSLQNEIREKPENFYLTFDIYDLLFD